MKLTNLIHVNSRKTLSRMILIGVLFVSSISVFAQNQQVHLSGNNLTLKSAFKQIEQQTKLFIDYNIQDVNDTRIIKKIPKGSNVKEILKQLLEGTNCTVTFSRGHAIISRKSSPPPKRKEITGVVKDENGIPIIGANIIEKGTTNGTITDLEGRFFMKAFPSGTLIISYIGYASREISINNQTHFDLQLSEDTKTIDEVVVVGYGTQKKANLTGSVATASIKDLNKRQVAQTSVALQGLVPGLTVTQSNGQPGNDGGSISIRGKTTLNNNSVLILVDGVEANIDNIDPSIIESISVLKDAASSAIYGSRAANGVILVTTKRASNDKLSLSYNTYMGWQRATNLPKIVGAIDHMNLINEAYGNAGSSPLYTQEYIDEYQKGMIINPDRYPNTDWYDSVLTGSGFMQNHTLTMSGGVKNARVMAMISYLDQKGIVANTNFKRYSIKINSDFKFSNMLSAKVDVNIIQKKGETPSQGTNKAIHDAGRIPANQASVLSNGMWGEGWNGSNPVAYTRDGGLKKNEDPSVILSLGLKFQPFQWLFMDLSYSPKYWQSNVSNYSKAIQTYTWDGNLSYKTPQKSSLNVTHTRNLQNNLKYTLNLEKSFKENYFKVLVGFQQEDYRCEHLEGYKETFTFEGYPYLDAGSEENQKAHGNAEEWALRSFFGRVNYSYKDRYLFEANYRYDGSSRFAPKNRWGGFPSFSVGWRVSEEEFFSPIKNVISYLKLRTSWGQLGNQNIGTYPSTSTVNLGLLYAFGNNVADGAAITNMANTDITWETTTVTNVGIDLNLWDKLNIVAEYYYKKTEDILLTLDVPKSLGLNAPYQNAGVVENRGWDLSINYSNQINHFKYEIGFNISDVKNKILDLKGISKTGITVNREGYSMNSIYGLVADGYITKDDYDTNGKYLHSTQFGNFAEGDIKYIELNGDKIINEKDYTVLGETLPRFTYGISINTEYRNFDFSLLLQGVGKANGLIHSQGIMPFYTGGTVQEQHKDHWTPENLNAKFPRLAFNETNNTQISSFWMKNAAYLRLKNIQFGYTLPKRWCKKIYLQDVRLYVSGQNLFNFDKFWDGYDVEAPVGDGGYYPQQKTYMLGLSVKF